MSPNTNELQLTATNYHLWKVTTEGALQTKKVYNEMMQHYNTLYGPQTQLLRLDGETLSQYRDRERTTHKRAADGLDQDKLQQARGIIVNRLSMECIDFAMGNEPAAKIWRKIEVHQLDNQQKQLNHLRHKMDQFRWDGLDVMQNFKRFKGLLIDARGLGMHMDEDNKIWQFLRHVPSQYSTLAMAIKGCQNQLLDDVVLTLQRSYDEMEKQETSENVGEALYAGKQRTIKCFNCNKLGHISRNRRAPRRQRPNHQPRNAPQDGGYSAHASIKNERAESSKVLFDSGATNHMSNNKANISQYERVHNLFIRTANGSKIWVAGIGNYHISETLYLPDTYYIPGLSKNLISVNKLCKKGFQLQFTEHNCKATNTITNEVLYGSAEDGLYYLSNVGNAMHTELSKDIEPLQHLTRDDQNGSHNENQNGNDENENVNDISMTTKQNKEKHQENTTTKYAHDETIAKEPSTEGNKAKLWHMRLGHVSFVQLKKLATHAIGITAANFNNQGICDTCVMEEMTRKPIKMKITQDIPNHYRPLDMLDGDLMGPIIPKSCHGMNYVCSYIDHATRYVWTFPIASKSDQIKIFDAHVKYLEAQFQKRVKILRSDNGGEY